MSSSTKIKKNRMKNIKNLEKKVFYQQFKILLLLLIKLFTLILKCIMAQKFTLYQWT